MNYCNRSLFVGITFNGLIIFFLILWCTDHACCNPENPPRPRFTSVSDFPYMEELYLRLRNNSSPREDVFNESRIRQFECEEITGSGYFERRGETPFDANSKFLQEKLKNLHKPIFHEIFKKRESYLRRSYKYKNPYENRYFEVSGFVNGEYGRNIAVREDVFICVTIGNHVDAMFHYYVSKIYNVNGEENSSANCTINGRFIFSYNTRRLVALAEEPSTAIVKPNFEVERHYLEIRERHYPVPVEMGFLDPLCKMVVPEDSLLNQWSRLCSSVLGSLYFIIRKMHFPEPARDQPACQYLQISIQTNEAEIVPDRTYYEWVIPCKVRKTASDEILYYLISRAYVSNQVFVYNMVIDDSGKSVRLENLTSKVCVKAQVGSGRRDDES